MKDSSDGSVHFRQCMSRRTEQSTDYGPAQNNAATVLHIDLQMVSSIIKEFKTKKCKHNITHNIT